MTYMHNHPQDMDSLFEGVYEKLKSPDFGKNLGGELALYIQPVPPEFQNKIDEQVQRMKTALHSIAQDAHRMIQGTDWTEETQVTATT